MFNFLIWIIFILIRPVRIQAFKAADTFIKRLEKLAESMVNVTIFYECILKISHIYKQAFCYLIYSPIQQYLIQIPLIIHHYLLQVTSLELRLVLQKVGQDGRLHL